MNLAYVIQHASGASAAVLPSADADLVVPPELRAQTVFLGVGLIGYAPREKIERLWDRSVLPLKAEQVVPVHWDNFAKPLSSHLSYSPWIVDNPRRTLRILNDRKTTQTFRQLQGYERMVLPPRETQAWTPLSAGAVCRIERAAPRHEP